MRRCFKNLEVCSFEDITVKPKTAFVFMPFEKRLEDVYQKGIKKKLEDLGWSCHRADEKFDAPEIICTICKNIQESSLIIADLTCKNPNVFLEVGLAFGFGKYVLLLSQRAEDIPFDTKTFRTIIYNLQSLPELMKKLEEFLEKTKLPTISVETPETRSEKAKLRREHSLTIVDQALKRWLDASSTCTLDAKYSSKENKFIGVEPQDPIDLDYFDVAKSHLESAYPDVLRTWAELKNLISEHNRILAILLNEIKEFITKSLQMPITYSRAPGKTPTQYIYIDNFAKSIYEEIKYRVYNEIEYFMEEPMDTRVGIGDKFFHELSWKSYRSIRSREVGKVEKAIRIINSALEVLKFREDTKTLLEMENEIRKNKLNAFQIEIKEVIKSVELGNVLRGKCRFCS